MARLLKDSHELVAQRLEEHRVEVLTSAAIKRMREEEAIQRALDAGWGGDERDEHRASVAIRTGMVAAYADSQSRVELGLAKNLADRKSGRKRRSATHAPKPWFTRWVDWFV